MAVQVPGLIVMIVLYITIAAIGIIAGRKSNRTGTTEELFLANRDLGLFVASFTSAATIVGGAYVNGISEAIGRDGVLWCIAPVGYNIGFIIVALVFVPTLRKARYTTILDPYQVKYGNGIAVLLFLPELCGNLLWEAAILSALGTTLSIILDIDTVYSIITSAVIAVSYTLFGGMYSVAYTDVIQLFLIFIGLTVSVPFAATNPFVNLESIGDSWIGEIPTNMIGLHIDTCFMTMLGGIPWQALHQRVFACKTQEMARRSLLIAAGISFTLGVPPAVAGVVGRATDWNMTDFDGEIPLTYNQWGHIFPMVLEYLCPKAVSILGIAAVSAAVMSSADSCVLATGSVFTYNVYSKVIRPTASEKEFIWILRVSILAVGALGTAIAITVQSVYGLFVLAADMIYVVQFPQLVCVLWVPFSNIYGSVAGFFIGLFFRISGGEPFLKLPALIKYPLFDETSGQLFPFKTLSMLISMVTIILVSFLTHYLFNSLKIDTKYDFLKQYQSTDKTHVETVLPLMEQKNESSEKVKI